MGRETFEMQKQMAMGDVSEAKIAELTATFAGDFAPCIEYAANPEMAGPTVTGTLEQVMQTIAPIWLGFKITRVENTSFTIKAEHVIVVSQVYDIHLTDASGVEIPGTANKAFQATQTVTYDANSKISAWVQEYDQSKILASRQAQNLSCSQVVGSPKAQANLAKGKETVVLSVMRNAATGGAPQVETWVKSKTPKPIVCADFLSACMSGVSGKLLGQSVGRPPC